jgi:hypothetical protein
MRFVSGVAAPTVEGVIKQHPSFELLQIVRIHAGEAKRSRGGMPNPNSATMVSNVQVSPLWLQNTFSMSNGTPPKRSATGRSDKQEHRVWIDEATDEPRTSDPPTKFCVP